MDSTNELLRMDAEGRVRTPSMRREQILDEFERSGMSAAAFAKAVGIKYQTLATWIQKRRKSRTLEIGKSAPMPMPAQLKWVEAAVTTDQTPATLVVQLPGGASLQVSDSRQAALAGELLRAFNGGRTC